MSLFLSRPNFELQKSLSSQNSLKFNFKNILEKRFFDWKPLSSIFGDRDAVSKYLKSVPPWPPSSTMIWPLREKNFSQVFLFVWQRKIKSGPTWIQAILYLAYTSNHRPSWVLYFSHQGDLLNRRNRKIGVFLKRIFYWVICYIRITKSLYILTRP